MHAEAERLVLDLARVARAHGRDRVGVLQPAFEERQAAPELDAVDRVGLGRQPEARHLVRREQPLEREVVDRHHRRRPCAAGEAEIGGREPGLPVVAVEHVRPPVEGVCIAREQRRDARELAEAQRVVRPVHAVAVLVGPAVALEERGAVQQPGRHAARQWRLVQRARGKVRGGGDLEERRPMLRGREHRRVRREQHADVVPQCFEGSRQSGAHVGEPAGLHPWRAFGRGEEDAERFQGRGDFPKGIVG